MTTKETLRTALVEIQSILEDHPTNSPLGTLNPDEEGYDPRARYAYLVAKDVLLCNPNSNTGDSTS